ncbi:hypothetical protein [Polymorphospora sp. NPDC050346]|uniref:hypothetical protein n=1 Tax=Polymorphospora sp. NPDC050346 TaxID=3155780 RepID=UPI0033FE448D
MTTPDRPVSNRPQWVAIMLLAALFIALMAGLGAVVLGAAPIEVAGASGTSFAIALPLMLGIAKYITGDRE